MDKDKDKSINLRDKSVVDKIIVKKQACQLLNTNREFFPSLDALNFHKVVDESSQVRPNIVAILYFVNSAQKRDKEASNMSDIISTHLETSFEST